MTKRVGDFVVKGDNNFAQVTLFTQVMEEFSNITTTNKSEPSAFNRALAWAEEQPEGQGED
jgi:hypothetical protein